MTFNLKNKEQKIGKRLFSHANPFLFDKMLLFDWLDNRFTSLKSPKMCRFTSLKVPKMTKFTSF